MHADVFLRETILTLMMLTITPLVLAGRPRWTPTTRRAFVFFAVVLLIDNLVLVTPYAVPSLQAPGLTYNWTGKLLSFGFGLTCLYGLRIASPRECGWTLRQAPGSLRPALLLFALIVIIETPLLWLMTPAGPSTIEDHLFQLTLPGLDEELMYRGILLALLDRTIPPSRTIAGAKMGWAAPATAVLFGAVHAMHINADWSIHLNWMAGILPGIGGLILVWMRARTGSLLLPILLHNVMNEAGPLIVWIKTLSA